MATLKSLQVCLRMMKEAMNSKIPAIDDSCPKCGAGCDQREFIKRDFLDIEAVHMHYICQKCGSEIIEEFTLSDVFIDDR
jgi:ribosomal protein S27AE